MALLKARNKDLISDGREHTLLQKAADIGATTLTVEQIDTDAWAQNDLIIIGEIGSEATEIRKINDAVANGTSVTVTALQYAHPAGTPIYRTDFDRVEFYNAATLTGAKTNLTTVNVQPDDLYTRYNDTTNTTGFGFFRFLNSVTGAESTYSDGVPYTGYTVSSLSKIRERTRRYLSDKNGRVVTHFNDPEIDDAINDSQSDIAQEMRFPFAESRASFSSVANQREYNLANITDASGDKIFWGRVSDVTFRTQPLVPLDEKLYNDLHWDSNTTGDPSNFHVRAKKLLPWPVNTDAAQTTAINDATDISATDTTIVVDSTSGFASKGRIIIDSEVIEYDSITSTSFLGCTRGLEGTTAASHTDNTTVTARDIIITFYARPTRLINETDETVIDDPDLVAINAALFLIWDRPEDKALMDRLQLRRDRRMALLKEAFGDKYAGQPGRTRRRAESRMSGRYWPSLDDPRNLTGS